MIITDGDSMCVKICQYQSIMFKIYYSFNALKAKTVKTKLDFVVERNSANKTTLWDNEKWVFYCWISLYSKSRFLWNKLLRWPYRIAVFICSDVKMGTFLQNCHWKKLCPLNYVRSVNAHQAQLQYEHRKERNWFFIITNNGKSCRTCWYFAKLSENPRVLSWRDNFSNPTSVNYM